MQKSAEIPGAGSQTTLPNRIPVTVIIPTRNEARHVSRCLEAARLCAEIYVVDSESTDETVEIAHTFGAKVVQFHYAGGWPKKRQWALDSLPIENDWVLLRINFLGRQLRFGGNGFWKLSLFRRGKGHFECRLRDQDHSMSDIEVHEHVVVDGRVGKLRHALPHHNVESLARYLAKHNEYSNWEARVLSRATEQRDELPPALFGNQAQRRRWLKKRFFGLPGSPIFFFLYKYILRLGFLDGVPGLIYCVLQSTHFFHIKAKMYELEYAAKSST